MNTNKLIYYWAKFYKHILRGKAIKKSKIDRTAKIGSGSNVFSTYMGRYSYCGSDCELISCDIGNFCSISDHVFIGGATHPMEWVSMSPVFQKVKHSGPSKRFAYNPFNSTKRTIIGHDVWIGHGVIIMAGVTIGTGAVVGGGSVVTKDVEPYAVYAGNPAHFIRYRFEKNIIEKIESSKWWDFDEHSLKTMGKCVTNPSSFIEQFGNMME